MPRHYKNAVMKELSDQLVRYAPKDKKLAQMDRAEELFRDIRDNVGYSYKYVCLRITDFQSEIFEEMMMDAADVRCDLLLLIQDLSVSVDLTVESVSGKVWTIDEICHRFHVTAKTVSRWRQYALCGRLFLIDGKRRVGFFDSSVEWFTHNRQKLIERSSRFHLLTETEKQRFIKQGRELAVQGLTPTQVACRLAVNSGRSAETIRYLLKTFDINNADIALFPQRHEPLHEEEKWRIFRSFRNGEKVSTLAGRCRRTVGSVYRIIDQMRAVLLRQLPITFIDSPQFDMIRSGNEEERVCGPMPTSLASDDDAKTKPRLPEGLPAYMTQLYDRPLLTPEQEFHLFRKMNYLKYKAVVLRDSLHPNRPCPDTMQQIEQLYNDAVETKNEIVSANLRLVVSIAKKHVGPLTNLFELISDGNLTLIRAVDKFDFTRGNRFSTYGSWAIMRNFARTLPDEKRYREHFLLTDSDIFEQDRDNRAVVSFEEKVQREREEQVDNFLRELDVREQHVIINRFGLGNRESAQTLSQVGDEIGVTRERVRQIETRALAKLRQAAKDARLEIPGLS